MTCSCVQKENAHLYILFFICALILFGGATPQLGFAAGNNDGKLPREAKEAASMLLNGDFEEREGNQPKHWKNSTPDCGTAEASAEGKFITGSFSLCIDAVESRTVKVYSDEVDGVCPGGRYVLSFFAKSQRPNHPINVVYYSSSRFTPHWYKEETFLIGTNWKRYTFAYQIPPAEQWGERQLSFSIHSGPGKTYIDHCELKPLEEQASVSDLMKSPAYSKNLLANPGFEAEWFGWSLSGVRNKHRIYTGMDERGIEFDTADKMHGLCSLKMPPNSCVQSCRVPFTPGKTYTLSGYVKMSPDKEGSSPGFDLLLLTPMWKYAHCEIRGKASLRSGWHRYSMTLTPPAFDTDYRNTLYVRIDSGDNEIWVDSMQLEEGDSPTAYSCSPQIIFRAPHPNAVYAKNVKDNVALEVYSQERLGAEQTLSLSVTDVYGKTILAREIPLEATGDKCIRRLVELDNHLLGVFHAEARLSERGKPIAGAFWRYLVVNDPTCKPKNIYCGSEDYMDGIPPWGVRRMSELSSIAGCGFTRDFYKSNVDLLKIEDAFEKRNKYKIKKESGKMVMTCFRVPDDSIFRGDRGVLLSAGDDRPYIEKQAKIWAAHANILRDVIDYYQILNECNIDHIKEGPDKGKCPMPPERYVRLLRAAKQYIQGVYPQAKIAANINGTDFKYAEELFRLGVDKNIDIFTFHAYRASPEDPPIYEDVMELYRIVDRYAGGMKMYNDEQYYGCRSLIGHTTEDRRSYFSSHEDDHAGRIVQSLLHHIAARQTTFSLHSHDSTLYCIGVSNPVWYWRAFGGYRAASELLHDVTESRNIVGPPQVRAFLFERADGKKVVSLNTRQYPAKGALRMPKTYEQLLDFNGNPLDSDDVAVDYLPKYLVYASSVSTQSIVNAIENADGYGFDFPLDISFAIDKENHLVATLKNFESRSVSGTIQFESTPPQWGKLETIRIDNLAAGAETNFAFDIVEKQRRWDMDYHIRYTAATGDAIVTRLCKIPSIFVSRGVGIRIDGDLGDWTQAEMLSLSPGMHPGDAEQNQTNGNAGDLSAQFGLRWDSGSLFVAVSVLDDAFVPGNGVEGEYFKFDSLQLCFDLKNNASEDTVGWDADDVTYQIGFDGSGRAIAYLEKNPSGRFVGANNTPSGIDDDVEVAFRKTKEGYNLEMRFPKEVLPFLKFVRNSIFGFALLIHDNDGGGPEELLSTAPEGIEAYRTPILWKAIQLIE